MLFRLLPASFSIFVAFATCLSLVSCGGDKPDKKGSDDAEEEGGDLQSRVDELLEAVKKGPASKDDLESIDALLAKAADATEKGKADLATKHLKQAEKKLKGISEDQRKAAEEVKKIAPARTAANDARKQAEKAKAAQNAPEPFKQGVEAYKKAVELAQKGSVAAASQAKLGFTRAKESFEESIRIAKENETVRGRAETEKKEMLAVKERARSKAAEEKAPTEWLRANGIERDGDSQLAEGDFSSSKESYKSAALAYQQALEAIQFTEEDKKLAEEQAKKDKEYEDKLKQDELARKAKIEEERKKRQEEGQGGPPAGGAEPVNATASIPLPEGFDPTAEAFKQEIDAEDEEFLNQNYKQLTDSGIIEYDMSTGAVLLDYQIGNNVRKDALPEIGKKEFLTFKMEGMPNDRGLTPEEKKKFAPYSFSGNTKGAIYFPVPFRFCVNVEWYMQILTMSNNGAFGVYVMLDKRKNTGYMTNWCQAGSIGKQLGAKGVAAKFLRTANEWFNKRDQIPMVVKYVMSDAKTGTLTNIYNNDDAGEEGDTKQTTIVPSATNQRGIVGFWWNMTKFSAMKLKISGVLDKQAAVDLLRKKLKQPKAKAEKPKSEKAGKDKKASKDPETTSGGEGESDSGEEGGTEGDGAADTPKKSA